jgi:uncharacterized protein YbjQ (UPF0145 family)
MTCSRCKKSYGSVMAVLKADIGKLTVCPDCLAHEKREERVLAARASKILLTTTNTIEGRRVTDYLGIESVEIVMGTGILSEITGDLSDFVGRRSTMFEQKLQAAKAAAFERLRILAVELGGDAVIGIDIDYTEFSGNRIGLIVNGTIVQLDKAPTGQRNSAPDMWAEA